MGGSFQKVNDDRLGHLFCWDGISPQPVGYGVDGSVRALVSYQGLLVVGGTFRRAYQSQGDGLIHTGNLAAWNGSAWSLLGEERCDGGVSTLTVNGSFVYVGGSFRKVGQLQVHGLARYDGEKWSSIGGGVAGGSVFSIAVNGEFLFVGGNFRTAGNLSVNGLARWDSREWRALGDFNGDIHGVAVLGPDLFVAGEFTQINGMHVDYIARYTSGRWERLGDGGVNAGVTSLAVANACLYFAGEFTALRDAKGEDAQAAHMVGRYCPQPKGGNSVLQGLQTSTQSVAIRAIAPSADLDGATKEALALSWRSALQQPENDQI